MTNKCIRTGENLRYHQAVPQHDTTTVTHARESTYHIIVYLCTTGTALQYP